MMTRTPEMARPDACRFCGGIGRRLMLPEHVNPFKAKLPAAANAMADSVCINCNGTGRALAPRSDAQTEAKS